jgi:uncharacterized protein
VRFRLSEIQQPREFDAPVDALDLELGFRFNARVAPTRIALTVTPRGAAHRVEGAFDYAAEVPCSRCLRGVSLKGRVEFLQEYRPLERRKGPQEEIEVTPEDDFVVTYENDALSTDDLVRQQLYLELPEKPLCGEGCRGICPQCGVDRNETPCACVP